MICCHSYINFVAKKSFDVMQLLLNYNVNLKYFGTELKKLSANLAITDFGQFENKCSLKSL